MLKVWPAEPEYLMAVALLDAICEPVPLKTEPAPITIASLLLLTNALPDVKVRFPLPRFIALAPAVVIEDPLVDIVTVTLVLVGELIPIVSEPVQVTVVLLEGVLLLQTAQACPGKKANVVKVIRAVPERRRVRVINGNNLQFPCPIGYKEMSFISVL